LFNLAEKTTRLYNRREINKIREKSKMKILDKKVTNIGIGLLALGLCPIAAHAKDIQLGDTTVTLGGYVDLDVHFTRTSDGEIAGNSAGRDFYIAQSIPVVSDDSDVEDTFDTDFTAQTSRLKFSTSTPTEIGDVKTHIETDFAVSDFGNEAVSNSFQLRLRRAYIDWNGWRVGQEWSTFQGLHALPEMATFLLASESVVFSRQPQIRYTTGNLQVALENPNTNVGGIGLTDDGFIPDGVIRYNLKGTGHNIAFKGIARQLAYEDSDTDINSTTFGYGASITGRVNVGNGGDDIRFGITGGEGLGRYVGLGFAPGAYLDANGELEAVPSLGVNAAYRKVLNASTSVSIGASAIKVDNDTDLIGVSATTNKSAQSGFLTVTKRLAPKFTVAVEGVYGRLEQESGDKGNLQRLTLSFRRDF